MLRPHNVSTDQRPHWIQPTTHQPPCQALASQGLVSQVHLSVPCTVLTILQDKYNGKLLTIVHLKRASRIYYPWFQVSLYYEEQVTSLMWIRPFICLVMKKNYSLEAPSKKRNYWRSVQRTHSGKAYSTKRLISRREKISIFQSPVVTQVVNLDAAVIWIACVTIHGTATNSVRDGGFARQPCRMGGTIDSFSCG